MGLVVSSEHHFDFHEHLPFERVLGYEAAVLCVQRSTLGNSRVEFLFERVLCRRTGRLFGRKQVGQELNLNQQDSGAFGSNLEFVGYNAFLSLDLSNLVSQCEDIRHSK